MASAMREVAGRLTEGEEAVVLNSTQQTKSPHPPAETANMTGEGEDEEEERRRRQQEREEAESIELARALMAEEAMASYEQHFMIIRDNNNMSEEDRQVWQAAMREEEREQAADALGDDEDASYDAMLQLGERIGDVKTERWTIVAKKEIDKLPTFAFESLSTTVNKDDANEAKCLICQCEYDKGDVCCRLPCGHVFHKEGCVDQWLLSRDFCPYCRQSIVVDA